jgi:hypothetical protein
LFLIFIESAFGAAAVVAVVVVVVVPDVLPDVEPVPDVVVPVVVLPDVVVVLDAVVVVGLWPTPGFDVFAAALVTAPLPLCDPLALEPPPAFPDVVVGAPPLFWAAEWAFDAPPLGAAPDLPCARTGATLTAAITADVANSRNSFMYRVPPRTGMGSKNGARRARGARCGPSDVCVDVQQRDRRDRVQNCGRSTEVVSRVTSTRGRRSIEEKP